MRFIKCATMLRRVFGVQTFGPLPRITVLLKEESTLLSPPAHSNKFSFSVNEVGHILSLRRFDNKGPSTTRKDDAQHTAEMIVS